MNLPTTQNIDLLTSITAAKPKLSHEARENPFGVDFDSELKSVLSETPSFDDSLIDQSILERQGTSDAGAGRLIQIKGLELESETFLAINDEIAAEFIVPITPANELALMAGLFEGVAVNGASDRLYTPIATDVSTFAVVSKSEQMPALKIEAFDQKLFTSPGSHLDPLMPITKDQSSASVPLLKFGQVVSQNATDSVSGLNVATDLSSESRLALTVDGDASGKIDISQFSSQSQSTIAQSPIRNLRSSINEAKPATAINAVSAEGSDEETFDSRSIITEATNSNKNTGSETQGNLLSNKGATAENKILSQKNNGVTGQSFNAELESVTVSESASGKFDSSSIRTAQSTDGASRMQTPSSVKFEFPENMSSAISKGASSISIKISPRYLGEAKLTLTIHQGIVSGTLFVETSAAKLAVESSLDSLIDKLAAEDIALDRLDVEVNDRKHNGAGARENELLGDSESEYSDTEEALAQDNQYKVDSAQSLADRTSGISSIAVDTFA